MALVAVQPEYLGAALRCRLRLREDRRRVVAADLRGGGRGQEEGGSEAESVRSPPHVHKTVLSPASAALISPLIP